MSIVRSLSLISLLLLSMSIASAALISPDEVVRPRKSYLRGDVLDVDLRQPGTLKEYISPDEEKLVRCIRLSGSMNGDDAKLIKKIGGRSGASDAQGRSVDNYLDLELERVRIVGGGGSFLTRTEHDVISSSMFSYMSCLRYVSLPRSLRRIDSEAFEGCGKLEEVRFMPRTNIREIGDEAFRGCSRLKRINLPEGIELLGDRCFYGCSDLRNLELPLSLREIGKEAFHNVPLSRINLPYNLSFIGADAFDGTNLTSLLLPAGVTIENDSPGYMPKLKEFIVERGSDRYSIEDGVLYDDTGTKLLYFPPALKGYFTVPNGVETIRNGAFVNCLSLEGVTFPESLGVIGSNAFDGCSSLKTIDIPENVKAIGTKAFADCKNLSTANVLASVTTLPERMFEGCSSLKSVLLSSVLEKIGESAFEECKALVSIDGAESLRSIGKNAFKKSGIEEMTLPATVTTIEENAFRDCKNMKSLVMLGGVTAMPKEMMRGCDKLTSITLPIGLRSIGENALRDCKSLPSLILPDGVVEILNNAFRGTAITQLTLPASIQTIGDKILEKCKMQSITCLAVVPPVLKKISEKKTTLYVPASSVDAYKSAKPWKDFKNILPVE